MNHSWELPYASRRAPVMAANIVATSQPLAVQAGLQMLHKGGNAVDAAIATAITLTVVEPNNNGIGSDAFALVWDGKELHGLNASGRSPAAWSPQRFSDMSEMPISGWDAVTVPGAVSGGVALAERFCELYHGDVNSKISYSDPKEIVDVLNKEEELYHPDAMRALRKLFM